MVQAPPQKAKADKVWQIGDNSTYRLGRAFLTLYLAVLIVFYATYNIFPGLEFLVLCFFIYASYRKWARRFIKDWFPFVALFLAYEAMYGIADNISGVVHASELIGAELQIFGTIPTLTLQQFYRTPILDYLGAFFYSMHFIAPTLFGFILWRYSPKNYRKYTLALLTCTYSALITFLVFPSAPPWFAVKANRVLFQIDHEIGVPVYATIFDFVQPNPFAAFPSLHATYPWLISLYAIKIKRIKGLLILLFPVGVWFSAVYLGEHYVVDLIGGVAYSTISFFLVEKIIPRLSSFYNVGHWFDRISMKKDRISKKNALLRFEVDWRVRVAGVEACGRCGERRTFTNI